MIQQVTKNSVAGNKGLQPLVQENELRAYHVTWVTHNSRVSERMVTFGVKRGEPIILDEVSEKDITRYILQIIQEDNLKILAYSICADHVHMILVCSSNKLSNIVRKLKGRTTQLYKVAQGIDEPFKLWAQKYHYQELVSEVQMQNTLNYVTFNRQKHQLADNKGLQPLVALMLTPIDEAFCEDKENVVNG